MSNTDLELFRQIWSTVSAYGGPLTFCWEGAEGCVTPDQATLLREVKRTGLSNPQADCEVQYHLDSSPEDGVFAIATEVKDKLGNILEEGITIHKGDSSALQKMSERVVNVVRNNRIAEITSQIAQLQAELCTLTGEPPSNAPSVKATAPAAKK